MRRFFFVLLVSVMCCVSPIADAATVLCFGDSIILGASNIGIPGALMRIRPDLTVTNAGVAGDRSSSVGRLATLLTLNDYTYVVIMIGVNDWAGLISPAITVRNIQRMVNLVTADGAIPIVLTLTPVTCSVVSGVCSDSDRTRQRQVAEINPLLVAYFSGGQHGAQFGDLNAAINATWTILSFDGLHPTNHGNLVIARFVSSLTP